MRCYTLTRKSLPNHSVQMIWTFLNLGQGKRTIMIILLFCKFSTMSVLPTKPGAQCGESRALGFCPNLYSEFSGDAIVRELGCMNTMYWRIAL